jgi:hypothetical protein
MDEPLRLVAGSQPVAPLAETASFEVFVTDSQARLFGSLCLMTGSRHEAEEIAHEAYVRVLERWDHVQRLDGEFGSLDWEGGQVDDGPYTIVDDDTLRIGDTAFHYRITEGGDTLSLSPVLTQAMIREALADPKKFSEAGWAVSVAYPGYTWQRVPCDGWC